MSHVFVMKMEKHVELFMENDIVNSRIEEFYIEGCDRTHKFTELVY